MTGYKSKKAAAQDKLAQKSCGCANCGKKDEDGWALYCVACIDKIKAALAQPAQEPVAWAVYDKRGGSKSLHWHKQHSPDGDATMFDAVPLVLQRPWVGLTDEQIADYLGDEYQVMTESDLRFFRLGESAAKEKNG